MAPDTERYTFITEQMRSGEPLNLRSLDDLPPGAAAEREYAAK